MQVFETSHIDQEKRPVDREHVPSGSASVEDGVNEGARELFPVFRPGCLSLITVPFDRVREIYGINSQFRQVTNVESICYIFVLSQNVVQNIILFQTFHFLYFNFFTTKIFQGIDNCDRRNPRYYHGRN